MGKIAVDLQTALARRDVHGERGGTQMRALASGVGWAVSDVLCTLGPRDQPFEERHAGVCVALVVAGAFGYRSNTGRELLTPGSLLLGNPGECFECGHRHGAGDRCLSFHYDAGYFERLAADAGVTRNRMTFREPRIPPMRSMSPCIARACRGATSADEFAWDELVIDVAEATLRATAATKKRPAKDPSASAWSRVAQTVRLIDDTPEAAHTLTSLAQACSLSDFYFLRTFERVTGITPHQYILRARLRAAASRLADDDADTAKVLDIALDCGFNDLSNFNHAFRAEFGMSPRAWRTQVGLACRMADLRTVPRA